MHQRMIVPIVSFLLTLGLVTGMLYLRIFTYNDQLQHIHTTNCTIRDCIEEFRKDCPCYVVTFTYYLNVSGTYISNNFVITGPKPGYCKNSTIQCQYNDADIRKTLTTFSIEPKSWNTIITLLVASIICMIITTALFTLYSNPKNFPDDDLDEEMDEYEHTNYGMRYNIQCEGIQNTTW